MFDVKIHFFSCSTTGSFRTGPEAQAEIEALRADKSLWGVDEDFVELLVEPLGGDSVFDMGSTRKFCIRYPLLIQHSYTENGPFTSMIFLLHYSTIVDFPVCKLLR